MHILIVDDSLTYRLILRKILGKIAGDFQIESVDSGENALEAIRVNPPDLVLLDMTMPGIDGIETLRRIKAGGFKAEVVMVSGLAADVAAATLRALEGGALDFITKPDAGNAADNEAQLGIAIGNILEVIASKRSKSERPTKLVVRPIEPRPTIPSRGRPPDGKQFSIIVVGVSTGGPVALGKLVPMIPSDFQLPIVIVQHMPPVFTAHLAAQLDRLPNSEFKRQLMVKK